MAKLFRRAMQLLAYRGKPLQSDDDFTALSKSNPDLTGRELTELLHKNRTDAVSKAHEAVIIREMRVQFNVEKSLGSEPNKCDITISNLATSTHNLLTTKPVRVELAAGYDGAARYLFTGDLRDGRRTPDGTELNTELQLGDGDRAYRYGHVNRSYKKGTSVLRALQDAASGMGMQLPRGLITSSDLQEQFSAGVSLYGNAGDELTRLIAPYGYRWSIQNGALQILKDDETREDRAWLIDSKAGLVGSPTWATPTKVGETPKLSVTCALFPELAPGGRVRVVSKRVNGIFRIEKLTHTGDTDGDDWTTAIEAKQIANKVD